MPCSTSSAASFARPNFPLELPPPERGRVGVGVHCASDPSRTALRSDLPLSGGGKKEEARRMNGPRNRETGEDRLIARFFKPLASHPGALGLTDDAAFIAPPPGCDLVLTTDAIVGGMH